MIDMGMTFQFEYQNQMFSFTYFPLCVCKKCRLSGLICCFCYFLLRRQFFQYSTRSSCPSPVWMFFQSGWMVLACSRKPFFAMLCLPDKADTGGDSLGSFLTR